MHLVTFQSDTGPRLGVIRAGTVVDLADALRAARPDIGTEGIAAIVAGMPAFLAHAACDFAGIEQALETVGGGRPLSATRLLAPVQRPGKIIGVGRNYGAHAAEGGLGRQDEPRLFVKMSTSVIGHGDAIICPPGIVKLDWEVELAVVVGRTMKDVPVEAAPDYVAGYMLLNDVSAREYQFDVAPPQTTFAKSMDSFTPTGPWLATASSFDGKADHTLRSFVNGSLMQEGRTADMIFSTAYVLSYISRFVTLEPGDVIATGTPAGIGHFRDPPVYLKPGDTVRMEIAGLGILENQVAASARRAS